jgi:PEP-CTERM motif-containing protein
MDRATISQRHATVGASQCFNVRYLAVAMAIGLFLLSSAAQAVPLNLVVGKPDIGVGPLSLSYNATTDLFSIVNGTASLFTGTDNVARAITGGDYDLSATITGAGALTGGTFSITGAIPSLAIANTTLLAGNLTAFGFSPDPAGGTAAAFEFLFTKTSSAAALGFGDTGGIKINAFSITPSFSFASNFTANQNSSADNFAPVPEPATMWLMGMGAAGLFGFARRRLQNAGTTPSA